MAKRFNVISVAPKFAEELRRKHEQFNKDSLKYFKKKISFRNFTELMADKISVNGDDFMLVPKKKRERVESLEIRI